MKANTELLRLYKSLGHEILQEEQTAGYGSGLIPQLSKDLSKAFPGIKSLSKASVFHVRKWFSFYASEIEIVEQLVIQSDNNEEASSRVSQLIDSLLSKGKMLSTFWVIPRGHHLQIFTSAPTPDEARYYLTQTAAYN